MKKRRHFSSTSLIDILSIPVIASNIINSLDTNNPPNSLFLTCKAVRDIVCYDTYMRNEWHTLHARLSNISKCTSMTDDDMKKIVLAKAVTAHPHDIVDFVWNESRRKTNFRPASVMAAIHIALDRGFEFPVVSSRSVAPMMLIVKNARKGEVMNMYNNMMQCAFVRGWLDTCKALTLRGVIWSLDFVLCARHVEMVKWVMNMRQVSKLSDLANVMAIMPSAMKYMRGSSVTDGVFLEMDARFKVMIITRDIKEGNIDLVRRRLDMMDKEHMYQLVHVVVTMLANGQ